MKDVSHSNLKIHAEALWTFSVSLFSVFALTRMAQVRRMAAKQILGN